MPLHLPNFYILYKSIWLISPTLCLFFWFSNFKLKIYYVFLLGFKEKTVSLYNTIIKMLNFSFFFLQKILQVYSQKHHALFSFSCDLKYLPISPVVVFLFDPNVNLKMCCYLNPKWIGFLCSSYWTSFQYKKGCQSCIIIGFSYSRTS